jgi:hypothetical protein
MLGQSNQESLTSDLSDISEVQSPECSDCGGPVTTRDRTSQLGERAAVLGHGSRGYVEAQGTAAPSI